jgi:hypothetical protein
MCRRDHWQVPIGWQPVYRQVIANGPPDIETIVRRRVDSPAGCRAAAEPARLTWTAVLRRSRSCAAPARLDRFNNAVSTVTLRVLAPGREAD